MQFEQILDEQVDRIMRFALRRTLAGFDRAGINAMLLAAGVECLDEHIGVYLRRLDRRGFGRPLRARIVDGDRTCAVRAIAELERRGFRPRGTYSDANGAALAEICRQWLAGEGRGDDRAA